MRLFVAVWPPAEVGAFLERLPRPEHPTVRWTSREQWHVTIRFFGEVADEALPGLTDVLRAVAAAQPRRQVVLGPVTRRLGRRTLAVPVAGLDDLGSAVVDATRAIGSAPRPRPFHGHLTLARARGDRPLPRQLAGQALEATWLVDDVHLVRSHLEPTGARYETLETVPLTG